MDKEKIRSLVLMGMMTALLCVLSLVSIPLPSGVPITLQTFAVALCGYVLGWKRGLISTAGYLCLGALGLPVFAGMRGGVGVLLGVTGGYLWGFLFLAFFCGLGAAQSSRIIAILLGLPGLALCHLLGAIVFALLSGRGPLEAFLLASAPYLLKDLISVAGAYAVSQAVQLGLKKAANN